MRRFSSYGALNNKLYYYIPRETLIKNAITLLKGEEPDEGGHYITVWAHQKTNKTQIMREAAVALKRETQFDVANLPLQHLYNMTDVIQD